MQPTVSVYVRTAYGVSTYIILLARGRAGGEVGGGDGGFRGGGVFDNF